MNTTRRKALEDITEKLEDTKPDLEFLRDEEQDYIDNMPDNLHGGDKYEAAEQAVSNLDDAINSIEEAIASIIEATGG